MYFRCALLFLALLPGVQAGFAADRDDAEIVRWINSHAQRNLGDELPTARAIVVGDLDGDGRDDVAVLYTLRARGQGGERRYLAVFKRAHDNKQAVLRYHAHVLVGGSGAAEVNRATILDKTVLIEMLTYRAGDPACCPTRPAARRYRLTPRGLAVVNPPVNAKTTP